MKPSKKLSNAFPGLSLGISNLIKKKPQKTKRRKLRMKKQKKMN